jgi:hypothetical protein
MDSDEHNQRFDYEIGDIVTESEYIIPPGRKPWVGMVVGIDVDHYELHSFIGIFEDLVMIHWLKPDLVEALPASVLKMVQKVAEKEEDKI